jgi:hypothetical protein
VAGLVAAGAYHRGSNPEMIVFNDLEHAKLISQAIPRPFNVMADVVISNVDKDGKLLGGVTYDGFTGGSIFMHQAGFTPKWLSRAMLWVVFDYPFNQLNVKKVCGTIPSYRKTLLEFNERLGFKEECRIKDAYPDGDMIVLSMPREECRWLSIKQNTLRGNK